MSAPFTKRETLMARPRNRQAGKRALIGMAVAATLAGAADYALAKSQEPKADKAAEPTPATKTPPNGATAAGLQNGAGTVADASTLPLTLAYQLWNGLPVVTEIVNDKAIERFVISTGLNVNTVQPAANDRLQLALSGKKVRVVALDNATDAPEVGLQSLKMGALRVENSFAALLDVAGLLSRATWPDTPTGWLGTPFLSAFQMTLDPSIRLLKLESPQAKLPHFKATVVVPLILRDGRIFVTVTVPGAKPFPALVDTGTMGTLVPADVPASLKLAPAQTFPISGAGGKSAQATVVTLPLLRVGKAEQKGAQVVALTTSNAPGFDPHFAVLGMDFFSRFYITINYAQQKMALTPLESFQPPPKKDKKKGKPEGGKNDKQADDKKQNAIY